MSKYADKYLDVQEWGIAETGFRSDKSRVSESLFSLANEHVGTRGHFEEGYSGDTLKGTYVNGIFERLEQPPSYRGVPHAVSFIVNAADWTRLTPIVDGERLDLARVHFSDFHRALDFRTGVLTRSFTWKTATGKELELRFERFHSMDRMELAYQRLTLQPRNFSGSVEIEAGIDFSLLHEVYKQNYWNCPERRATATGAAIRGETVTTGKALSLAFALSAEDASLTLGDYIEEEKYVGRRATLALEKGRAAELFKTSAIAAERAVAERGPTASTAAAAGGVHGAVRINRAELETCLAAAPDFESALAENRRYWDRFWDRADIEISGDGENQQGIRFCLFQLEQTYRGHVPGANIAAKGLTGEFYNGNAFWDTEVYCLPYYLYKDPAAARALLHFRYDTLGEAKLRAAELDCDGACFPVATIDGSECCTLWQHANLQLQPTTAVAYAVAHYFRATGDEAFLFSEGAELLAEIARFLSTRVGWSPRKKAWGFYGVMGPDEFQMMVNHNAYTNWMGARSLEYAVATLKKLRAERPGAFSAFSEKLSLTEEEIDRWDEIARGMYIPRDGETGLIEQHEGYFDLPHVDIKTIPAEEFPLYHHWSYDRIYRNDMIKQPDVLMLMFLYDSAFTQEEKRRAYDYYESRTIHESSLSPSIHSILAAELGKFDEAFDFFKFATRIDLDDYNRNAREGLHLTAIAASWMNIVYGFGGFRSDGDLPGLSPSLPAAWTALSFKLTLRGSLVKVELASGRVKVSLVSGGKVEFALYGERKTLSQVGEAVEAPLDAAGGAR